MPNEEKGVKSTTEAAGRREFILLAVKPRFTDECNHCGKCCETQLCEVSKAAYGNLQLPPCPALTRQNRCAIVEAELAYGKGIPIAKALGIGCGCSMPDNTTTEQEIEEFDLECRELLYG